MALAARSVWEMEHSTVVRAHPCVAGARKKEGGQSAQALGRSRGGFSTKIHVNVGALGNPLRFLLTAGQRHDITQADELIAGTSYNADNFRQVLADKPAEAVIVEWMRIRRANRSVF